MNLETIFAETRIRLYDQDYLEIKSQINFLSRLCDITEIFSLNKLFRFSKLIILDRTKTKIILVILQNPSNDDLNPSSNYHKIIKLISDQDDNIHSIIMINLFARIESDIKNWKNINQLIDQDEKNNMIYIKNNIFNISYDEYYLGYGQHIQYMYKSKIFRPIYCEFLSHFLLLENIIMKKFHSEYCKIDKKFELPGYPFPSGRSKPINITMIDKLILQKYYDNYSRVKK